MNFKRKIITAGILAIILFTFVFDFVRHETYRNRRHEATSGHVPTDGQWLDFSDPVVLRARMTGIRKTYGVNFLPVMGMS